MITNISPWSDEVIEGEPVIEPEITDSPIVIETGLLNISSFLDAVQLIETLVHYECEEVQELIFEYSTNSGVDWHEISRKQVEPTQFVDLISVRKKGLSSATLQIRM